MVAAALVLSGCSTASGEQVEAWEPPQGGPATPHYDDIYAEPRPNASDAPPSYDYAEVANPEAPFDHAPIADAYEQALEDGDRPDDAGLIRFEEPITEITVEGDRFTVDGVIDPGQARPLGEDEYAANGRGPLAEELTGIPWPEARRDILENNVSAVPCTDDAEQVWVPYDTDEGPTCFDGPGGVPEPFFEPISAVCSPAGAEASRVMYMGLGGDHSFTALQGDRTGWDLMIRGPRLEAQDSCFAFTLPVRGAQVER